MNLLLGSIEGSVKGMQTRHVNLVAGLNATGVGTLAESYFLGLREVCAKADLPLVARHYAPDGRGYERLVRRQQSDDTTLFFWLTDPQIVRAVRTRRVLWMMFESTRLPSSWIAQLADYDQIWVSSSWGREVLRANGFAGDVAVVAGGVNDQVFFPVPGHSDYQPGKRKLRVLMVGKYERRKGYDVALQALARLSRQIPLTLVAKPDFFMFPDRVTQFKRIAEEGGIELELVSGFLSSSSLAQVYRSGDVFLFPSRAEGFGLPCIEALACGLPTVVTNYSGQASFLNAIQGLFREIRFQMVPLVDQDYSMFYQAAYGQEPLGEWAEPSADSIVEGLLDVATNYQAWQGRALEASAIIRERFCWNRIARDSVPHL